MVVAAQFSIALRAAGGTRLVSEFLELSGLSAFVGVSDGAQHALNVALEAAVVAVADQQRTALAEGMAPRQVTACEDETFHAGICLVTIEPVSNFILPEHYAVDRTAAEPRHCVQAVSTALLDTLRRADLFQRSSSCVEGRNGQLSLHHHGRHRLSDRKLAALTAVHNLHIRRPDGTTAAERLFGRTHPALFEQLLLRVPLPPRPRRRRPRPPKLPYLMPVAA